MPKLQAVSLAGTLRGRPRPHSRGKGGPGKQGGPRSPSTAAAHQPHPLSRAALRSLSRCVSFGTAGGSG